MTDRFRNVVTAGVKNFAFVLKVSLVPMVFICEARHNVTVTKILKRFWKIMQPCSTPNFTENCYVENPLIDIRTYTPSKKQM